MAKWWIGCSGFHYKEWKEVFYPKEITQAKWFEYYCTQFNTIELNVTFYRFPTLKGLQSWYNRSPVDFKFSVKGPRLISHYKMFNECESLLGDFYAAVYEGLQEKLGCVLFQLPASIKYSDEMLERIIGNLDPSFDNVMEFRDSSWWTEKVFKTLKKHKITFSGISHPKLKDDVIKNNSILYYRFHGIPVLYKSEYKEEFIREISEEVKASGRFKEAYTYFNNTWGTGGINNALQMQKFI